MRTWAELDGCRLRYLREALDDAEAGDCERCDRCTDSTWQSDPDPEGVARAQQLLRGGDVIVPPRKQWPSGLGEPKGRIAADRQPRPGRALARLGDGGWGPVIERLVSRADAGTEPTVELNDDLLWAIAGILKRWDWQARPTWICPMPSRRRRAVIDAVADGLGELGRLPVHRALTAGSGPRASPDAFQADQANSAHQVVNVWHRLVVDPAALPEAGVLAGPVLLIDDEIASRWTVTVAAWRLTEAGSGPVLPLALRSR